MNLRDMHEKMNHIECFLDEPVDKDVIDYSLENARLSNSKKNMQPFRYIAVVSEEKVNIVNELLTKNNSNVHIGFPKAYIIIIKEKELKENVDIDLGIVYHTISMSLCEKSCENYIVHGANVDKIVSILDVPQEYTISMIIAVGKVK